MLAVISLADRHILFAAGEMVIFSTGNVVIDSTAQTAKGQIATSRGQISEMFRSRNLRGANVLRWIDCEIMIYVNQRGRKSTLWIKR